MQTPDVGRCEKELPPLPVGVIKIPVTREYKEAETSNPGSEEDQLVARWCTLARQKMAAKPCRLASSAGL